MQLRSWFPREKSTAHIWVFGSWRWDLQFPNYSTFCAGALRIVTSASRRHTQIKGIGILDVNIVTSISSTKNSAWRYVCVWMPTECVRSTAMILDRAMFHSSSVKGLVTSPCVAWRIWSSTTKNLIGKIKQNVQLFFKTRHCDIVKYSKYHITQQSGWSILYSLPLFHAKYKGKKSNFSVAIPLCEGFFSAPVPVLLFHDFRNTPLNLLDQNPPFCLSKSCFLQH